ncbi:hypothetical protein WOLCODRAFT_129949 [Wolfiporia cocos MD-104 SS10]|uniref:RAVE complex protein Rav1 C-terminal domain-containing protein n=1 Tax=Wolfiporia cocos (strain MD-104) TaxID=742152 RepID=A0A2H3IUT4_WOLCO|nr:hypothetical protein WOLCODRAFT_129949 [Wolfiporia cocos MD-104 SS10]
MLDLVQAYTGYPAAGLQFLLLPREILLLYSSDDCVIIHNTRSLAFLRALAFWEAFPGTRHSNDSIRCLTVDPGMKLVVAAMSSRVAVWTLSGTQSSQASWRLHSTLVLPPGQDITAIDCKSGLLAVGTQSTLSVYTLILEDNLPTWSQKWSGPVKALTRIRFSPSLMYIATTSAHDNTVRLHSTTSGRQTQAIPHPRPVTDIAWRHPQSQMHKHIHGNTDELILYTTTADGTLRVFLPVLDAPQRVQLHVALDTASVTPISSMRKSVGEEGLTGKSSVFSLDRDAVLTALQAIVDASEGSKAEDARSRRVMEIVEEGWDLFLRVLSDGSFVIQAVANIDRRPPTLLRHFNLLQSAPGLLPSPLPSHLYVLPSLTPDTLDSLILVTSAPLASYSLVPLPFFDARADGLVQLARAHDGERGESQKKRDVIRFVRTPEGDGVAAMYADGSGATWRASRGGHQLVRKGGWDANVEVEGGAERDGSGRGRGRVDKVVVLDQGKCFVTYSPADGCLTMHATPPATLAVPPLLSLFSLPSSTNTNVDEPLTLVGVTEDHTILLISASLPPSPALDLQSESSLPLPKPPKLILPVDPMAWSGSYAETRGAESHDVLLSVSEEGDLAFWVPSTSTSKQVKVNGAITNGNESQGRGWSCTGRVRTGRRGFSRAACSSAKKSVLVVPAPDGEELTIWDSKTSEFSLGLEFLEVLSPSDPINDLDWTATPDAQSILAIGFAHRVELLCQQRKTYFDDTPGWGRCWVIDLGRMFPHPISDSIWLARGSLLVGSGHLMCLFGQPQVASGGAHAEESLFEQVARLNGPLDDYHPQMLLQCLLWEKVELVKRVIVNLARHVRNGKEMSEWTNLPLEDYFQRDEVAKIAHLPRKPQYSLLYSVPEAIDESEDDQFSRTLVHRLLEHLEEFPLPHLTPNEHASLLVLIQTTLEIEEQRRALDSNGLRYLISMRSFYITNHRLSAPNTPSSARSGAQPRTVRPRQRLRYRDIIWAFHSESQELLLSASVTACGGKMTWPDARALGVFLWMRSAESMKTHMEVLARNQYMAGDNRDPVACSLFYFALGKTKLVHGLWRQAAWHKEQSQMLKFLGNDFSQPRWRTAALKNAFALLSKRRFEYAAAFFLLGGSLKDAVNVCIRNLSDFQLAVALARVVEQGDDGPVLRDILQNAVLPLAFQHGSRWLASWAFWLLRRRDLAVRILVTPLQDIAAVLDVQITDIGDPHYDDPSLALLFSQLRARTLQAVKGTSEISGHTEFNFVLQMARVFCGMGCHVLAIDLVRTWSFQRPSIVPQDTKQPFRPPGPISTRFALDPSMRRRSSILIDMEPATGPPTRAVSPAPQPTNGVYSADPDKKPDDGDLAARKVGLGTLMKTAKQDVHVPEFDMSAFF